MDILHRIGITGSSPEEVYTAITTLPGLSGWWASDTTGDPGDVDGVIAFRFGPGGFDMRVVELDAPKRVVWTVIDGPDEWIDTRINWRIEQDGDFTIVLFEHEGWREPVEFMYHCSTKWATFLLSLKALVETGEGRPDPRDLKISNWH